MGEREGKCVDYLCSISVDDFYHLVGMKDLGDAVSGWYFLCARGGGGHCGLGYLGGE